MVERLLFPRLSHADALSELEALAELSDDESPGWTTHHENQFYAPIGGEPIEPELLREVRDAVEAAVVAADADEEQRSSEAAYDLHVGMALHETAPLSRTEAAHEEVWSWITLVLLPDFAVQRFPSLHVKRMTGHPRNVFRRVWWRREVLGELSDPRVSEQLGEDEFVGIFERPTVGRDESLARTLVAHLQERTAEGRSEYTRVLARTVLRDLAHLDLSVLDAGGFVRYVEGIAREVDSAQI